MIRKSPLLCYSEAGPQGVRCIRLRSPEGPLVYRRISHRRHKWQARPGDRRRLKDTQGVEVGRSWWLFIDTYGLLAAQSSRIRESCLFLA